MRLFPRGQGPRRQTLRLTRPPALTASAVGVGAQDAHNAALTSHAPVGGQMSRVERALGYYDSLGECWYPSQFYSRAMKRIRYYPAVLNDAGEPEEVEEGTLRDLFDRIHDPGGTNMIQLASNYGKLAFLVGDGYLLASAPDDEEQWEYLSPLELKKLRGTDPQEYERSDGLEKTTLVEAGELDSIGGDRVRVWRLYRRHPARSGWSDAPVLSILELYALLERLTLAAGATSGSRMALRDLFYLPSDVTIIGGDDPNDPGVDEDPLEDSAMRELIESITTAISDPGDVSSIAPLIARGPAVYETSSGNAVPYAQLIARIQMARDNPYFEADAWPKVIERIALGLDMPNEMVTGTGAVNHWGGWLLDEQGFRQHVAGVVEDFCDDIGSAYLRPAAKADGIADFDRVVVWYDPVAAIAHPDEEARAKDAWENGSVSRAFYRDKIGATEDDAPTPEDETFLLELKGRRPADATVPGETAPQDGGTGGDTTEAPPAEPANGVTASSDFHKAALIVGAAEMQLRHARKAAGARLVQRAKRCGECQEIIENVPHGLVAYAMGRQMVRTLMNGHAEVSLVAGVGDLLAEQAREFGLDAVAEELGAMVESVALRTLYDESPPRLPAGFVDKVERALR